MLRTDLDPECDATRVVCQIHRRADHELAAVAGTAIDTEAFGGTGDLRCMPLDRSW
jgi:hypothetical protein